MLLRGCCEPSGPQGSIAKVTPLRSAGFGVMRVMERHEQLRRDSPQRARTRRMHKLCISVEVRPRSGGLRIERHFARQKNGPLFSLYPAELRETYGIRVGCKRVERLMRQAGLQGVQKRRFRCTTRAGAAERFAPDLDLVQRHFTAANTRRSLSASDARNRAYRSPWAASETASITR